jgi:RIO kinase 1
MRIPNSLTSLANQGIIEEVVRPLMSGKEAEVFLVRSGNELRVAKVYKEAHKRSFKNRAEYTEGRKVRNSRDQRAIGKRTSHGKAQDEAAWRSSEVDIIYRLRDAGVRVPTPYHFIDGVLIMELITDAEGSPAPRLAEVSLEPEEAAQVFDRLLAEVIRMLCAGDRSRRSIRLQCAHGSGRAGGHRFPAIRGRIEQSERAQAVVTRRRQSPAISFALRA